MEGNQYFPGLDFLSPEDLLLHGSEFLDSATLAAICGAASHSTSPMPSAGAGIKRPSSAAGREDDNCSQGEDDDDDCGKGPSSKKSKTDSSQAAKTKACKEKARREKMNDRFAELAKLIEPGKEPKTDKPSILGDAIKYVQQMVVENHQLKMLNKFLEERVSHYERERGQALYQQSLAMQGMGTQQPASSMGAGPSGLPAMQSMQGMGSMGGHQMPMQASTMAGMPATSGLPNPSMYMSAQPNQMQQQHSGGFPMMQQAMQPQMPMYGMQQPMQGQQPMQPSMQQTMHMQQHGMQSQPSMCHPQGMQQQMQGHPQMCQQPMGMQAQMQQPQQQGVCQQPMLQQQQSPVLQQLQQQQHDNGAMQQAPQQLPMGGEMQQGQAAQGQGGQMQQGSMLHEPKQELQEQQLSPTGPTAAGTGALQDLQQAVQAGPQTVYTLGLKPAMSGLPGAANNTQPMAGHTMQQQQWMSPGMLDMAQDSLLRPPVA